MLLILYQCQLCLGMSETLEIEHDIVSAFASSQHLWRLNLRKGSAWQHGATISRFKSVHLLKHVPITSGEGLRYYTRILCCNDVCKMLFNEFARWLRFLIKKASGAIILENVTRLKRLYLLKDLRGCLSP